MKLMKKLTSLQDCLYQNMTFRKIAPKIEQDKSLVVFCLPDRMKMSGGVMSIFNLAKNSRKFNKNVILATVPSGYTYFKNETFRNNETVFRFMQVLKLCDKLDNLIIHIPEYKAGSFCKKFSKSDIKKLKLIKNIQINIMNQNIELMPDAAVINKLRVITDNITQTVAHHAYATQEVCDKLKLPLTLWPAIVDVSAYDATKWEEKENLIAYSNDKNEHKEAVLQMIREKLPQYRLIEIKKMTFDEYMQTITKAKFTISFGEGFDAYLLQPFCVGSIGCAVYNNHFFESKDTLNFKNIFESYADLLENFVDFVQYCDINHTTVIADFKKYGDSLYSDNDYLIRIERFYNKSYDFYNN